MKKFLVSASVALATLALLVVPGMARSEANNV